MSRTSSIRSKSGADVVSFSGDKLLGGPQAGIIVGKRPTSTAMKKNPLTRAFRIDKLTLAALEATLREYLDPQQALKDNPTLRMITATMDDLVPKGQQLVDCLQAACDGSYSVVLDEDFGQVGGGSVPTQMNPLLGGGHHPAPRLAGPAGKAAARVLPAAHHRPHLQGPLLLDVRTIRGTPLCLHRAEHPGLLRAVIFTQTLDPSTQKRGVTA